MLALALLALEAVAGMEHRGRAILLQVMPCEVTAELADDPPRAWASYEAISVGEEGDRLREIDGEAIPPVLLVVLGEGLLRLTSRLYNMLPRARGGKAVGAARTREQERQAGQRVACLVGEEIHQ